jgi:hypothetical protein
MSLCDKLNGTFKKLYASYLIYENDLEQKDGKYIKTYEFSNKDSKYKLDIVFFDGNKESSSYL